MTRGKTIAGEVEQGHSPEWGPLLDAVGADAATSFMWMFSVRCGDGRRLDAYKHRDTRGYLHLDAAGNAFVYEGDGIYRDIDREWLIRIVLPRTPAG